MSDPKEALKRALSVTREALIAKVADLPEREARTPRTPTGTNLIGIVKHCLNMEALYLGDSFGRPVPPCAGLVTMAQWEEDPQADWYATEDETVAGIIDRYRRVIAHADATIDVLELDTVGHVAHWDGEAVTLHDLLVHTLADLTRHAGQADILREDIDGAVGLRALNDNIPSGVDFPAYVAKLTALAESF